MNYERDVHIDENALDVEWLEQASLMLKYSRHEVDLEREKDLVKERLDLVRAELDKDIRENPDKYGILKITENVVANTVITQQEYKDIYHEFLDKQHEYNIAKVAVRAFAQRKDALENLVRLHGQQYFAGPKIPRDLSSEREKREARKKTANTRVRKIKKNQ